MNTILLYSYFVFGGSGKSIDQGTGFFVEKKGQLYLTTVSHNFHTDKTSKIKKYSFFYLRLFNSKDNKPELIKIENNPIKFEENIDLSFYKVDVSTKYLVNIIDIEETKSLKPEKIICYGYATVEGDEDNAQKYVDNIQATEFSGYIYLDYNKPITYLETKEKDYDNYVVKYISNTLGRGTSGSPVFFVKENEQGEIKYQFAGVIHTRNEETKVAAILRPEKVIEHYKRL
tara:strand:+ start:298 stop:987 length:690 start_codon:yes stop_codon:yes gene_type:complete